MHQAVTQQGEDALLREDHVLVVERAIFEAKDQPTLDAVAVGGLKQIAMSYGLAAHRPDEEQAMGGSLDESHLDGRSLETGPAREDHEDGQNAKPEQRYPLSPRCEASRCHSLTLVLRSILPALRR